MLNKGLEVIEACRLFDVPPEPGPRHRPSAVHRPLAGRIRRRLDPRADLRYRHAPAHPLRAGLAGAACFRLLPSTWPPSASSTSSSLISNAFPACAWPMRRRKKAAPTASPSTPPTRSPSRHFSTAKSRSSESRVQLKECLHRRRKRIQPRSPMCLPPIVRRVQRPGQHGSGPRVLLSSRQRARLRTLAFIYA